MMILVKSLKKIFKRILGMAAIDENCKIGKQTYIGRYSIVHDCTIGAFCSIGPGCRISQHDHYLYSVSTHPFINEPKWGGYATEPFYTPEARKSAKKPTMIENDVWIGSDCIIMRGVKIANGAVVGAGSVVTRDIPPYAIAVGNPAHVIRYRFNSEEIEKLLNIKWWEWNDDKLRQAVPHMHYIDDFIDYCEQE